jgi:hypothetical protein
MCARLSHNYDPDRDSYMAEGKQARQLLTSEFVI